MDKLIFETTIKIGHFELSKKSPVLLIGEIGVNHNGSIDQAKQLIDVAVDLGVNGVKFQTYKTENFVSSLAPLADYQKSSKDIENQFELLKQLELSFDEFTQLKNYANHKGIMFLSTPFDDESLEFLDSIGVITFKVSSTDLTNIPFVKNIAQKNKPVFLSTGMSSYEEIDQVLSELHGINRQIVLFQCTSNYPLKEEDVHLEVLNEFSERYDVLLGFSDHTQGVGASPYSVMLGAKVIEKHITLDHNFIGPDHQVSLDPAEIKQWVSEVRRAERLYGDRLVKPTSSEENMKSIAQKYYVAAKEIKSGDVFGEGNVVAKRVDQPGISPLHYKRLFGQKATRDYQIDELIEFKF